MTDPLNIDHEVRHLQWKLKLMGKQCGRQGDTIHTLRCQLAELRELMNKHTRGEFRRLQITNEHLLAENTAMAEQNRVLREQLRAEEPVAQPVP